MCTDKSFIINFAIFYKNMNCQFLFHGGVNILKEMKWRLLLKSPTFLLQKRLSLTEL